MLLACVLLAGHPGTGSRILSQLGRPCCSDNLHFAVRQEDLQEVPKTCRLSPEVTIGGVAGVPKASPLLPGASN
ncbi:unnamed protein product [Strongylus vulgaris]|uniref:Uncharacterized protein n=1 Tax=Strongylus vulgaris TaxID=40348 RepID=A0A3P7K5X2_STRVU|nr:unnamed protein product [Strongylus vulgaris]